MKKKRFAFAAIMLIAVLAIGVGYATLTDTLKATGDITTDIAQTQSSFAADVSFVAEGSDKTKDSYIVSNTLPTSAAATLMDSMSLSDSNDTATLHCKTLVNQGDTTVFYLAITNTGAEANLAAKIAVSTVLSYSNTEYFEITIDDTAFDDNLEVGQTKYLIITMKLLKTPTTAQTCDFTVVYTATAVEA